MVRPMDRHGRANAMALEHGLDALRARHRREQPDPAITKSVPVEQTTTQPGPSGRDRGPIDGHTRVEGAHPDTYDAVGGRKEGGPGGPKVSLGRAQASSPWRPHVDHEERKRGTTRAGLAGAVEDDDVRVRKRQVERPLPRLGHHDWDA